MIVIAAQTEFRLKEDLNRYEGSKDQRCFLLKFAQTDICKNMLFERCLSLLDNIPSYYLARIYLFEDKDIVIMMEGFMQRQFLKLCEALAKTLKCTDFLNLIDIFSLDTQKQHLHDICANKIENIAMRRRHVQKSTEVLCGQRLSNTLFNLPAEEVSCIHERRTKRTFPLVMVADDDQLCRTLANNALQNDYDIIMAKNGQDALKEYVTAAPDILFLDIGMPDIHGHDVLETLFQIDPAAHVIMFSSQKDKATILKSLELGAAGFLAKPFTRKQLYAHVENAPSVEAKRAEKKSGVA